jgi:hypothetical protein
VVTSLAIRYIASRDAPQIQAGFLKDTLLDPHAANNDAPGGRQYSVASGTLGNLARWIIDGYQHQAKDPLPVVPAVVDQAEVFYQHTPIAEAKGSNHGLYNLWGQVPVPVQGNVPVHYYNLTGVGISHGGDVGVPDWYQAHVVPTLGDGSPFVDPSLLTGGLGGGASASQDSQATFQGSAAPGATVRLMATPASSKVDLPLGRTVADSNGTWSLTTRSLPNGAYHVYAKAAANADPRWPRVKVLPKASLGTITVEAPGRGR